MFPDFVPAYDGVASLCKLLELLAPVRRPLSELVDALPQSTVVHRQVRCPFARKGAVMRVLTEQMRDREVDLLDGIKIFEDGGWAQVLPDPAEPLVHVYAEAPTQDEAHELEARYTALVQGIIADGDDRQDLTLNSRLIPVSPAALLSASVLSMWASAQTPERRSTNDREAEWKHFQTWARSPTRSSAT